MEQKILNFKDHLKFEITQAFNGFYVFTEEPSENEENTIIQRSIVYEEDINSKMSNLKPALELIYSFLDFFNIRNDNYEFYIKIIEKETGKIIDYD